MSLISTATTCYKIVGRADSAHFARSERLGEMLKAALDLSSQSIVIEMKHPNDWKQHRISLCERFGFTSFLRRTEQECLDVIVWNPVTNRLVGGGRDFRKEVERRYSIVCDLPLGRLKSIANENSRLLNNLETFWQNKKPAIIIAGPPASGKGSQAKLITELLNVVHISTGDLLRKEVKDETELGSRARVFMEAGQLIPDDVVIKMVRARLEQDDVIAQGYILDGFPRTQEQARALLRAGVVPDIYLQLNVPDEILIHRVVGRRQDPETGAIYHMDYDPPPPSIQDRCEQRADDTEEAISVRINKYKEHVIALQHHFRDILLPIDGTGQKRTILRRIMQNFSKFHV